MAYSWFNRMLSELKSTMPAEGRYHLGVLLTIYSKLIHYEGLAAFQGKYPDDDFAAFNVAMVAVNDYLSNLLHYLRSAGGCQLQIARVTGEPIVSVIIQNAKISELAISREPLPELQIKLPDILFQSSMLSAIINLPSQCIALSFIDMIEGAYPEASIGDIKFYNGFTPVERQKLAYQDIVESVLSKHNLTNSQHEPIGKVMAAYLGQLLTGTHFYMLAMAYPVDLIGSEWLATEFSLTEAQWDYIDSYLRQVIPICNAPSPHQALVPIMPVVKGEGVAQAFRQYFHFRLEHKLQGIKACGIESPFDPREQVRQSLTVQGIIDFTKIKKLIVVDYDGTLPELCAYFDDLNEHLLMLERGEDLEDFLKKLFAASPKMQHDLFDGLSDYIFCQQVVGEPLSLKSFLEAKFEVEPGELAFINETQRNGTTGHISRNRPKISPSQQAFIDATGGYVYLDCSMPRAIATTAIVQDFFPNIEEVILVEDKEPGVQLDDLTIHAIYVDHGQKDVLPAHAFIANLQAYLSFKQSCEEGSSSESDGEKSPLSAFFKQGDVGVGEEGSAPNAAM